MKKRKTRALVTGGAGFIGSHLVEELLVREWQVIVLDNLSTGRQENIDIALRSVVERTGRSEIDIRRNFFLLIEDIRISSAIRPVFRKADYVFHLAAQPRIQPSIAHPLASFEHNVKGTLNVLQAAKQAGVKKFIFSGSSSVYGDQPALPLREDMVPHPKNPYALYKLMGEQLCLLWHSLYNLPVVCLRYFNVYGERQSCQGAYATVVGIFLKQRAKNRPLTIVGDGCQKRDFTYVKDVVQANILAAFTLPENDGEIINIGAGFNYSVKEVAAMIWDRGPRDFLPLRRGETRVTLADVAKAKKILNWQPTVSLPDWIKGQFSTSQNSIDIRYR